MVEASETDAGHAESMEVVSDRPALVTLNILAVIRDAQQQHGLRHADYQRYRGYCSRRLRRLRKVLKLQQGDRRHYRRRDVTAAHLTTAGGGGGGEARFLCLPLMQAERAWAHAMQLRQEANTEPRKRFHLVQRLRKAAAHSLTLLTLAESGECSARTQLEAQAYSAALTGALLMELQSWGGAHEQLARAQHVYSQLAAALPHDERGLYTDKVEELQPSLRYCAYNIGDESAAAELRDLRARGLLHNIDQLMAQAKETQAGAQREVEWRGRRITVRPERVRVLLATLADLDGALDAAPDTAARLDLLDHALVDCKEAAQAARDEHKTGGGEWLLTYLTHLRLTLTVRRNNLLVGQAELAKQSRPRDLARLYEIILHNYSELQALPGLADDAAYQAELADQALAYRALRAFHIASVLLALRRWREALAMLDRAATLARSAAAAPALPSHLRESLGSLEVRVDSCRCEVHANSVLEASETETAARGPRHRPPLADRPGELRDEPSALTRTPAVCRLPPAMEPIPCKPLFFDLACNLLELPSADTQGDPASSSGLTGLVRGFLGWGSRK